jgi:hypothetical protein
MTEELTANSNSAGFAGRTIGRRRRRASNFRISAISAPSNGATITTFQHHFIGNAALPCLGCHFWPNPKEPRYDKRAGLQKKEFPQ